MRHKLNNKKGETLPRTWVMSILIFSAVFALLFLSSSDLINEYDEADIIDSDYRDNYDKFSDSAGKYRTLGEEMGGEDTSIWEILNPFSDAGLVSGLIRTVEILFNSVGIIDDLTTDFVSDFGVPEGVANVIFPLISSLLVVFLIFAIISSVNRGSKI